jgi:hypothetical protein
MAVAPALVIEDHDIYHAGGIDLMAAEQLCHAQHRKSLLGVATRCCDAMGQS